MKKEIKILYDLQLSSLDKSGKFLFTVDSNTNVATFTCNLLLKHRPEWKIYMLVPYPKQIKGLGDGSPMSEIRNKFTAKLNDKVELIPYKYANQPFRARYSFETETLKWYLKDLDIDLIYCNDPCKVMNWKVLFWSLGKDIPIISRNHWVSGITHRKVPEKIDFVLRQTEAAIYGDLASFNSKFAAELFLKNAEEHFTKKTIDKIRPKLFATETVDIEKVDAAKCKVKKDKFLIVWAHRLSYYTGWEKTFDALNELHKEGVPFELVVTDQGEKASQAELAQKYPFVFPLDKSDWTHEKYLKLLWAADLVIGNHQYPATWGGLAITEAMAAHTIPLMLNKYCYPEMFYKGEKVFFKDEKELKKLIKYYVSYPREAERVKKLARQFVEKELSTEKYAKSIITRIEQLISGYEKEKRN